MINSAFVFSINHSKLDQKIKLSKTPRFNQKKNKITFRKKVKKSLIQIQAMQTGAQNYDGVRIGPPPDLPSLLLHNRIVYLGMPLVPAVTELIVAEFLYLQYENAEKPIFMYLNSTGTSNPDGSSAGFETEAFAIADTMNYIKPPVHTICVGQALGTCAMLLSSGEPGQRSALPNATIMVHQPRTQARGQASDIAIKAREVLYNRKQCFEIIAKTSGQSLQKVMKDASRTKYLSPKEAVEYGIIDKILESQKSLSITDPSFLNSL
ncbi:ATP-dependent Clp protease proteolytic subunit (nucleomorph) [Chroomonas mesostigmatica CCMP1168]|uniref:ATP-dependent Clp protease proteolytic subunit n=1 Tax=Chroomonas mesostigmatica CCMP1168 TaxID=1195612 RepID=J7G2K1_9CRYP|nr:ATP-dependent Clp protease proteolytic subunit [Chroomonas mesostigmatica CCMP1168]|mmetsp:Transcript_35142/g.86401  ORF Transcript_35142/g.86401 Transcript_35142/m.86401 type:complete len:265 (+) Transcript_35142:26-820(+)